MFHSAQTPPGATTGGIILHRGGRRTWKAIFVNSSEKIRRQSADGMSTRQKKDAKKEHQSKPMNVNSIKTLKRFLKTSKHTNEF